MSVKEYPERLNCNECEEWFNNADIRIHRIPTKESIDRNMPIGFHNIYSCPSCGKVLGFSYSKN